MRHDHVQIELVEHNPNTKYSGISRYTRELYKYISQRLPIRLTTSIDPPFSRYLSFFHHLPLGVRDHKPGNIVHFTQIMGCSQLLWRRLHPVIVTVHDLGVLVCDEDEDLFNYFDRQILKLQFHGLKCADYYAVNSDYTRQCLNNLLDIPDTKIHFVQLGVDTDHFRPIPDARIRLIERYDVTFSANAFYILYVGSELPRKNLKMLLRAINVLKNRGYDICLVKVGGSGGIRWRMRFLSDIQQLGLSGDVVITDTVPEDDLPLFYNAVDLAISPTLLEGGFAWLAMEAMACGTPVIATDAALIPAAAAEASLVVGRRDLDGLVAAIARCIDDTDLRRRMGAAGPKVIAPFTWHATAEAMMHVYQEAMG